MIKKGISKLKEKEEGIKREVKEKTIGYILAAFGLVAGLAWNEAIKSFIDLIFPTAGKDLFVKLIYAVVVTLLVVFISMYLGSLIRIKEEVNSSKK